MFSAWLGMVVSRPGWSLCFLIRVISVKGFPYSVGVHRGLFARGACLFLGGYFFLCSRWRGRGRGTLSRPWATINLRIVGAAPEALSGRRLLDFFYQGAQAWGGVPGRLIYHLVGRR